MNSVVMNKLQKHACTTEEAGAFVSLVPMVPCLLQFFSPDIFSRNNLYTLKFRCFTDNIALISFPQRVAPSIARP